MRLLLFIGMALAVICVLFVAVTELWYTLLHALIFLVILFLIAVIIVLLFRGYPGQE